MYPPLPSLSARARRRVLDAEGKHSITFQDMREGFECNFFLLGLQARLPADVTGHVAGHNRPLECAPAPPHSADAPPPLFDRAGTHRVFLR